MAAAKCYRGYGRRRNSGRCIPARRGALALGVITAILSSPALARQVRYEAHRIVRVHVESEAELRKVLAITGDCWNESIGIGDLDVRVSPTALQRLERTGLPLTVLVENVQAELDRQRMAAAGDGGDWYAQYRTWEEIVTRLQDLAVAHPELVNVWPIGETIEGRPILAARIAPDVQARPAVVLTGCQHAREWLSPMVVMHLLEDLIEGSGDAEIDALLEQIEFIMIPVVNPDGYVYSWDVDPLWRKNRRDHGGGTFGVDLNRNWAYAWGGPGSSPDPASDLYHGEAAFSEPETRALRDLFLSHPSIVAYLDFHGFGRELLQPWASSEAAADELGAHAALARRLTSAIAAADHEHFHHGSFYELLYEAGGTSIDWTWGEGKAFSFTVELAGGFIPPPEQIVINGESQFDALIALAEALVAEIVWEFPGGRPLLVDVDDPAVFRFTATPLTGSALLPHAARVHWWTDPRQPFAAMAIAQEIDGTYRAELRSSACDEQLNYYLEVTAEGGAAFRSPLEAPAETYSAHAIGITQSFADDFEEGRNWSVSDDGALTEGGWARRTPSPGAATAPPFDADASGRCYFTGMAPGEDVDGGATLLTSPCMDASDPGSVISYFRWYSNTYGAFPQGDTLIVEVSDDGGLKWMTLETVGPDGPGVNGGWVRREFLVDSIAGLANTREFRIRFIASDHGLPATVEAAVDGVEMRIYEWCSPAPQDLDSDGLVGYSDLLVLLSVWGPCPPPPAICPGDIDGDGVVSITDLILLLSG